MKRIVCVWKKVGLTPLQSLDKLRKECPEYKDEKLSYAGRLDPLAEGVMLVLVGDENKKREKYLNLDKEYEFEVLFGIETDTYDLMGMPVFNDTLMDEKVLNNLVAGLEGKISQDYPPYSGKTFEGKKLFELAKKNELPKILPKIKGEIFKASLLSKSKTSFLEVLEKVLEDIGKVRGDFRQSEILKAWSELDIPMKRKLDVVKMKIKCSSGIFVRGVANEIGKKMGGGALAYSIKRTEVGEYRKPSCMEEDEASL